MEQNPGSLLAQKVVADLRKERLLSAKQLDELTDKLVSGSLKAEDWHLIVEIAVEAEQAKKNAEAN